MLNFISKIFGGSKSEKDVKTVLPLVGVINEAYSKLSGISNDELRGKTNEFRTKVKDYLKDIDAEIEQLNAKAETLNETQIEEKEGVYQKVDALRKKRDEELEEVLEEILPEAFAVVKETARRFMENEHVTSTATALDRELAVSRPHIVINGDQVSYANSWLAAGAEITWNMLHYDVQLIGGVVLHQGKIAEMATGEGKTLVATLPSYLNGLTGLGLHIVTVNDYLARRDSEWMAPILNFLGLTVDCIDNYEPHSEGRIAAYNCDITYGTNNEFGFDYLRDNMVRTAGEMVQKKLHYAMIDEVDSVLIDDARTPLIISGPVPKGDEQEYQNLRPRINKVFEAQRKVVTQFVADAKKKIAEGNTKAEKDGGGLSLLRAYRGLPRNKALIKFLSEEGMKALQLKVEAVYMQEQSKRMPEVDEELFFTIDEKNNQVELTEKGINYITSDGEDPEFFIMPDVGAAMADLENTEMGEEEKVKAKDKLFQELAIKSERVHSVNQLLKAYTLFERDVDYIIADGKVKIVDEQTGRVMEGRRYSDGLHQALEAKENTKIEAASQTFATVTLQNYFRMYHKLAGMTGTAETEEGEFWEIYKLDVVVIPTNKPIVRDDRDDLVYKTNKDKYNAVINEIVKLKEEGRPVLLGTTSVEISELLGRMLSMKGIKHNVLNAKQHSREADIVAEAGKGGVITIATNMAGRGTDIKLGDGVKKAGGLAIVGTERHDSRRVDRQLRGRAGRQGDVGSSQFFVSLEDDLMRKFGSERIAKVMDRMGYKEGEEIQHGMITKSIERAQKKVEENNFGIRKRLLEYDDIMNSQRDVIYKRRKNALFGERLALDVDTMIYDLCAVTVQEFHAEGDFDLFKEEVLRVFSLSTNVEAKEFAGNEQQVVDKLYLEAIEYYKRKKSALIETAYPVLKNLHETRGETITNVAVPITDGKRSLQVVVPLEEAINTNGKALVTSFEKNISLAFIDDNWKEHLRNMDDLKQSVQTATYEQKDPLLIYKFEAFELFKEMLKEVNKEITGFLFRGSIPLQNADQVKEGKQQKTDMSRMQTGRVDKAMANNGQQGNTQTETKKVQPVRAAEKVGRNEPCPCGSGKKFKQCHGKAS